MNILLLSRYGRLGASSRLRSFQFLPLLQEAGIDCEFEPLIVDDLLKSKYSSGSYLFSQIFFAYAKRIGLLLGRSRFDLIWIEKEALPWLPSLVEYSLLRGVPYVLDFDDAVFHNYDLHHSAWVRRLLGRRLDHLMSGARLVTAGNDYLGQRARDAGAPWVELVPTVIDLARYSASPLVSAPDRLPRIVWVGSPSTIKYLADLGPVLACLAQRCEFTLRVIGGTLQLPGVDVECVDWAEDSEVRSISDCDVGIMPLTDSPWERGKCGYKLIQYMACSLPVVASAVGANVEIVDDGKSGYLVKSADEWVVALRALLESQELRTKMGKVGRAKVEEKYCLQKTGPRLVKLLFAAGKK